jgi:membrane protein DedA with SNARE-associated domain
MNPLIVVLVLTALVVADFYLPMLPSATMVAALAGLLAADPALVAALIVWAAAASWLGDLLGYQALRRTRARMRAPIPRSASLTRLEIKLRSSLKDRPRRTAVVARFLPAGRTALAWAAVAAPDYPHSRMSALAALAWAAVTAGLGLLIGTVFGAGLWSAASTATTVAALSAALAWWFRTAGSSRRRAAAAVAEPGRQEADRLA